MWKKAVLIVAIALAASLPLFTGSYFLSVFNTIFVFMSLSLTWDMMLRTGQLSYGTAGLFGLGAYTS
ncbi:MAG TPA: branched-chain amino acid ABC transporter permease, partial [Firmicutes bacterium]|nr:branched-chain amino acid ABC transporter permease [Bacillota bacterium]